MSRENPAREELDDVFEACRLRYAENLTQKQIAQMLNKSEVHVHRLVRRGHELGLVRFSLHPPVNRLLEHDLLQKLSPNGIRSVIAPPDGAIGYAAAELFKAKIVADDTVVLDGGTAVLSLAEAYTGSYGAMPTFIPIAADQAACDVSATAFAIRMATKSPGAKAIHVPGYRGEFLDELHQRAHAQARKAHFVFLGTSPWKPKSEAFGLVRYNGLDPEFIQREYPEIAHICGYCALDEHGDNVHISEIYERLPRALSFADIRNLAANSDVYSVLLADRPEETDSVLAAVRARLCNTLIVGEPTAERLSRKLATTREHEEAPAPKPSKRRGN
jgi:DNA-binding transcriptional regulator LsrR (DeoR family)